MFWPANAIVLGLFLRWRCLATPWGWLAAAAGYLAADFATGGGLVLTLWLTAGNLAGVAAGYLVGRRCGARILDLHQPRAMLCLLLAAASGAAASTMVGAAIAREFYGRELGVSMAYWFATELANSVVLLPVMLCLPALWAAALRLRLHRSWSVRHGLVRALPLLSVVASVLAAVMVGGPGALAFPVPGLVWCALSYEIFATALITMVVCVWKMMAVAQGWVPVPGLGYFMSETISLRLGIALLAVAPLAVASLNAAREDAMRRLDWVARHDALTGALNRRAFTECAGRLWLRQQQAQAPLSVLMVDLDFFKGINDVHGHSMGDRVLAEVGRCVRAALREEDVLCRLGGEEFAVLLPGLSAAQALAVAERLREAIASMALAIDGGGILPVSASFGLAHSQQPPHRAELPSLERCLQVADAALYAAKAGGRNCVVPASALA